MRKHMKWLWILLLIVLMGGMRQSAHATTVNNSPDKYLTRQEAVAELRQQMTLRNPEFQIYIDTPYEYYLEQNLIYEAMDHTGNPTEGDYLLWQYTDIHIERKLTDKDDRLRGYITYSIEYRTTAEQEKEVDAAVQQILDELDLYDASDVDKAYGIHDYICRNVQYDYSYNELAYSAYGAIINNQAVCQGYTLMFYRLALELGIDNRILGDDHHGMNMVCMEGKYYIVDTTWDAGNEHYEYFLLSMKNYDENAVLPEGSEEQYPMGEHNYCGGSGTFGNGLKWKATNDGTLTISGSGAMPDYTATLLYDTDVRPPWLRIQNEIQAIVIEDGITYISEHSFYEMPNLKTVRMADSVTAIGKRAFGGCTNLKFVYFDGSPEEWERIEIGVDNDSLLTAEFEFHEDSAGDICGGDHQWGDWEITIEPTCTEEGMKALTCSACGRQITETIEALDHFFGEWYGADDFDCTLGGTVRKDCQRCGLSEFYDLPPTTHCFYRYVSDGNATEESDGTKTAHCISLCCTVTDTIVDEGSKLLPSTITSDVYQIQWGYYPDDNHIVVGAQVAYIFGISPGTTKDEFLANLHQENVGIYDPFYSDSEIVTSGMIVSLWNDYMAYADWEIVVMGDVNCDGYATIEDAESVARVLAKEYGDYGYRPAMDHNRDKAITAVDLVLLRSFIKGMKDPLPTLGEGGNAQITGPARVLEGGIFTVCYEIQGSGILNTTGTIFYDEDKLELLDVEYLMESPWKVVHHRREKVSHYGPMKPDGSCDYVVRTAIYVAAEDESIENPLNGSAKILNLRFRIKDIPVGKNVKVDLISTQITGGDGTHETELQSYKGKVVAEGEAPVAPTWPTEPTETVKPAKPTEPTQTEKPTEPSAPAETIEPTEPSAPVETTEPTSPSAPAETIAPTEPAETENPTNPSTPAETHAPTEPAETENPTEPSPPVETTESTSPSTPAETLAPTEPAETENSTEPSTPAEIIAPTEASFPEESKDSVVPTEKKESSKESTNNHLHIIITLVLEVTAGSIVYLIMKKHRQNANTKVDK